MLSADMYTLERNYPIFIWWLDMADSDQRREFLDEIQLMKAVGSHKNIVNMLGCCTVQEPMFLLVEYVPCGDLLHYLRKHRSKVRCKYVIGGVYFFARSWETFLYQLCYDISCTPVSFSVLYERLVRQSQMVLSVMYTALRYTSPILPQRPDVLTYPNSAFKMSVTTFFKIFFILLCYSNIFSLKQADRKKRHPSSVGLCQAWIH